MNSTKLKPLLEKAGFVFWQDENWKAPVTDLIDWSCNYEDELIKLVELVIIDCAVSAVSGAGAQQGNTDYYKGRKDAAKLILDNWNVE